MIDSLRGNQLVLYKQGGGDLSMVQDIQAQPYYVLTVTLWKISY
jgi:hypothetical protein